MEKDYVVRTLHDVKCKSIDDCTSASWNNLPSVKCHGKKRIQISDTPAHNTLKETIMNQKMSLVVPIITTISEKTKVQK